MLVSHNFTTLDQLLQRTENFAKCKLILACFRGSSFKSSICILKLFNITVASKILFAKGFEPFIGCSLNEQFIVIKNGDILYDILANIFYISGRLRLNQNDFTELMLILMNDNCPLFSFYCKFNILIASVPLKFSLKKIYQLFPQS